MTVNRNRPGVCYFAPFSFSSGAPFSATITGTIVGASLVHLRLSGNFFMFSSGVVDGISYTSFVEDFKALLTSTVPGGAWQVGFDAYAGKFYMADENENSLILRVGNSASAVIIGCNPGVNLTGTGFTPTAGIEFAAAITSSYTPYNFWKSQYPQRSNWKTDYEPEPFWFDHETDDGYCYSIGRATSAIYSDWDHMFEEQSKVVARNATIQEPFTFQSFLQTVRSYKPWILLTATVPNSVFSGSSNRHRVERVGKFRSPSSNFNPNYVEQNQHTWRNITIASRVVPSGTFR